MEVFREVLKISFYMGILIFIILMFKKRLLEGYKSKFTYLLHIGILLRLLCVFNYNIELSPDSDIHKYSYNLNKLDVLNKHFKEQIDIINVSDIFYYTWILGLIIGFTYLIYYHLRFHIGIKKVQKEISEENILTILNSQKEDLNIEGDIRVYSLKGIYTPMIVGIIRPRIMLPDKSYELREVSLIFKDELIHYKRKDNLLKLIFSLVNIIYWFNPLVYMLRKNFNESCELSCDEEVIKKSSINEVKEYSLMLLDTIKYKNNLKSSTIVSSFNANIIKTRIEKMFVIKRMKSGRIIGVVLLVFTSLSLVSFSTKGEIIITESKLSSKGLEVGEKLDQEIPPFNITVDNWFNTLDEETQKWLINKAYEMATGEFKDYFQSNKVNVEIGKDMFIVSSENGGFVIEYNGKTLENENFFK